MGLFDKKYCDICGEKIGLLGNRKLENGKGSGIPHDQNTRHGHQSAS